MSDQPMTVGDLVRALGDRFPFEWAEEWDRVGLVAGDPGAIVRSILVTLDADKAAVRRAADAGCDVLLTHHPASLEVGLPLTPAGSRGVLFEALRSSVALVSLHTNLDRSPSGGDALPERLGLRIKSPLEASLQPSATVTTYVPAQAVEAVYAALSEAGAGRIGEYTGCSFSTAGSGRFTAGPGASPHIRDGEAGVSEARIECVCAPATVQRVVSAIRSAHPYEEPVIIVSDAGISRGVARLGRLCETDGEVSLEEFAVLCARRLGVRARVWGDPSQRVGTVAVGNGSAGSLVPRAIECGADVLLAGEVRYHDARTAMDAGLCVVEAGHDATEWPLVSVLAAAARDIVAESADVTEEEPTVSWWTTERV